MKTILLRFSKAIGSLNVTTKLMVAFGIMVALTAIVGFEGAHSAGMLYANSKSLFEQDLTGTSAIKEAGIFEVKCTRVLRDLVMASGNKDDVQDQKEELIELEASVDNWLGVARQAFSDAQSKTKLDEIGAQIPAMRLLSSKLVESALAGDQKGAIVALKQTNKLSSRINLSIAEVCRLREDKAKESQAEGEAQYRRSRAMMLGFTIFSILFASGLCLLSVQMIARPLSRVVRTLRQASGGNLTVRLKVDHRDEIGCMSLALNEALESIREVLQRVRLTATELGTFSVELAATADGMAQGAQAQAAGLEETSASLEQITATARNNAEHAEKANAVATHSRVSAEKGNTVVAAAVAAMNDINESSVKISEIASAVDEVAFQTNLLSVNAAIEAARAGEEGRSFAVVAKEIRHLSTRSAESAQSIRQLIKDSLRTVERGSLAIYNSGQTLKGLSSSVNEVTDFVSQIVISSKEQSLGVEQVHSAVLQMDKVTQNNAGQASNLSSAATNLSRQALSLQAMLTRFTLDGASKLENSPN